MHGQLHSLVTTKSRGCAGSFSAVRMQLVVVSCDFCEVTTLCT